MRAIDPTKKRTQLEMKEGKRSAKIAGRRFKKILKENKRISNKPPLEQDLPRERGPMPPIGDVYFPEAVKKQVDATNKFYVKDYAGLVKDLEKYVNQLHCNMLNAPLEDLILHRARYEVGYAIVNHLKKFTF